MRRRSDTNLIWPRIGETKVIKDPPTGLEFKLEVTAGSVGDIRTERISRRYATRIWLKLPETENPTLIQGLIPSPGDPIVQGGYLYLAKAGIFNSVPNSSIIYALGSNFTQAGMSLDPKTIDEMLTFCDANIGRVVQSGTDTAPGK